MFPIILLTLYLGRGTRSENCDVGCRVMSADDIQIADGVRLVKTAGNHTGRSSHDTLLSSLRHLAGRYDLHVKLGRLLLPREELVSGLRSALAYLSENEGRGNGGKKGSGLLMLATMMGGTMAALGFGALGMLTMKALTVSAMALMISVIMGLKKLLSKQEHESGHIVSYVPVHHASRRRRDLFGLTLMLGYPRVICSCPSLGPRASELKFMIKTMDNYNKCA